MCDLSRTCTTPLDFRMRPPCRIGVFGSDYQTCGGKNTFKATKTQRDRNISYVSPDPHQLCSETVETSMRAPIIGHAAQYSPPHCRLWSLHPAPHPLSISDVRTSPGYFHALAEEPLLYVTLRAGRSQMSNEDVSGHLTPSVAPPQPRAL